MNLHIHLTKISLLRMRVSGHVEMPDSGLEQVKQVPSQYMGSLSSQMPRVHQCAHHSEINGVSIEKA